jgi:hypothetical protein
MKAHLQRLKPFCVILTIGIGACGVVNIFSPHRDPARLFSHKLHVQGQQLDCKSCHGKAEKEDKAGMPLSLKKCMLCHEGVDEKKPDNGKLAALLGEKPVWSNFTELDPDIKFSHKTHLAEGKNTCTDCHAGMDSNESVSSDQHLNMESCTSCHAQKSASNDCLTCHKEIRKDAPPPSHNLNWKQNHGPVARTHDQTKHENDCSLCHTESSCSTCHQEEAPASHTNFWRMKGHTIAAQTDRSQCATCHQEDSCNRCHDETAPSTHTAGWGEPRDLHCLTCHDSPDPTSCTFCHRDGTPSHSEAADKPSWHNPGMNCRQCHGQGQPLPHPDNGDNCNDCHH